MNREDILRVDVDNYHATILISALPDMSRASYRRVLKSMSEDTDRNADAFRNLHEQLRKRKKLAEVNLKTAEEEFNAGWRYVENKRSRRYEIVEIMDENKRLQKKVKQARARLESYKALLSITDGYAYKFE